MSEPTEQLREWLAERATAFGEWADETGTPETCDFTPASLNVLEQVVRKRFADVDHILAERSSTFVQGAVWYVGETVRRALPAVEWGFDPWEPAADEPPGMFASELGVMTDSPYLARPGQGKEQGCYPLGALNNLLRTADEYDRAVNSRLRELLDDLA